MARFGAASLAPLIPLLALVFGVTGAGGAYVIRGSENDRCSQKGMNCSFSSSNCMDPAWVQSHLYTPSGPDKLDLKISIRRDLDGNLLPVINASWTLKDEGGISHLKASELHVVVVSTNQNICVRYSFNNKLPMRNPTTRDQWTLRSDVLVVDPNQTYRVSVENIPKPELDHSATSISRQVSVPGCSDPQIKQTQPCIYSGALWSPNISLSLSGGAVLTAEFTPDPLSEEYMVIFRCGLRYTKCIKTLRLHQNTNSSRLSASCSVGLQETACCHFHVEIKPYFSRCGNDCQRHRSILDLCPTPPPGTAPPAVPVLPVALGLSSVLLLIVAIGVCGAIICRRKGVKPRPPDEGALLPERKLEEHPTLLLIYSKDHPLYLDVVLKLAAFLQAHCGIVVLLDLLDSSGVSQVGMMRWLELQRNKLRPNDKILVLCSQGFQSKWKAMCGQGHVPYQPDDLVGPFLSLFLSNMHQPGSMGRYIASYFEEIASPWDVPSFFDLAVKYKLMKHFEELYFRVLDMEKYEPRRVNRIQGLGLDEYFRSPSGRRLRDAIETFHAFQTQNPDWFHHGETVPENVEEASLLIEYSQQHAPVSECVPIMRDGPQIFSNEVLPSENIDHFYIVAPETSGNFTISENEPILNAAATPQSQSVLELQPDPRPNVEMFQSDVLLEDGEGAGASVGLTEQAVAGFSCLEPEPVEISEMEVVLETEGEASGLEVAAVASAGQSELGVAGFPWSKADTSGSDQGYSSKVWTEPDSDDLKALLQLQQELMSSMCFYDTQ